jgi:predicted ATP-grasp superfamily ATP-dependent carboligase
VEVVVGDSKSRTLAGCSKFARNRVVYPDPAVEPGRFLDWMREVAADGRPRVVMPMTDLTAMLLAPNQSQLRPSVIACGPHAAYERLSDKSQLMDAAAALNIPVPATQLLHDTEGLIGSLGSFTFPLVLKPVRSRMLLDGNIVSTSVYIARNFNDAVSYLRSQRWFGTYPCLAQEYIEGHGAGVFALYANGRELAWFAHRRIREKPPEGGVSVLSESVPINPSLRSLSRRLLDGAQWHGPAMVEYRISTSGRPYLMEVNCRFWGSLQLAIDAGVDFPWILYQALTGSPVTAGPTYKNGTRLRWLLGDVDNLAIQLKRAHRAPKAAVHAICEFTASCLDFRARQEVFRLNDPRPAFHEAARWIRRLT